MKSVAELEEAMTWEEVFVCDNDLRHHVAESVDRFARDSWQLVAIQLT